MPDINETRRRFRLALVILLAVCLAAAGVLLSPIGNSSRRGRREIERLRAELRTKALETEPMQGIDRKVVVAQDEIAAFYRDRLPSSYASISEGLGAVAADKGVTLTTGHYKAEPAEVPGLQRLLIDVSISGDYLHVAQFINAAERSKTFFLIDSIELTEQKGGIVQLRIQLATFLKEA